MQCRCSNSLCPEQTSQQKEETQNAEELPTIIKKVKMGVVVSNVWNYGKEFKG